MSCIDDGTRDDIGVGDTADDCVAGTLACDAVALECGGSITDFFFPLVSFTTTSPLGGWPFLQPRFRLSPSSSLELRLR